MLGAFVSRFRVLALLLVFGLGLAGQGVPNGAVASQMQVVTVSGLSGGDMCPGCGADEQHGGMAPGCSVASCWTVPALPAQTAASYARPPTTYAASTDVTVAGIPSAPDPHPPRSFLQS